MTPWWDNTTGTLIGAIGGSALGVVAGLYGAAAGVLLPKGLAKTPMLALHFLLTTILGYRRAEQRKMDAAALRRS